MDGDWIDGELINGERIFSFDLPEELLRIYSENGMMDAEQTWDLKQQFLKRIQLVHVDANGPRIFWLELHQEWQAQVEARLGRAQNRRAED